jgi:hypothetical protein
VHDLPDDEKEEIVAYIGKVTTVSKIDSHGFFWIGFGNTTEEVDTSHYSGHSFCVTKECLEII